MKKAEKLAIQYVSVDSLIPYVNNARTHSAEQVSQIAASIKEFGFTNPVLIDGENGLIAGHGRVMAARKLGMKDVPCIQLAHLSAAQKRAYILADNKLAELSGWNNDLLALELGSLADEGFDMALIGFSDDELADLMREEQPPALSDEDAVPVVPDRPVTVPGDIWIMGKHRLMCGDSTSVDSMQKLTAEQGVDMWLTDPPYNVTYVGKTKDALTIQNDSIGEDQFLQFLRNACITADSVMKAGAVFYIWHSDLEGYNFRRAVKDAKLTVRQCLIWKKQTLVMGQQDYHCKHEPCLYGWKSGAGHLWASDRKQTTVLEFDRPTRNKEHPTMKPVELFEYQILNNTNGGDIVLDSFGGSGTTAIACEKNGRHARLMEIDPKYCDVIVKRWQTYTGKTALLEGDGRTFDAIASSRIGSTMSAMHSTDAKGMHDAA